MGMHRITVLMLIKGESLPVTVRMLLSLLSRALVMEKALLHMNMGESLCDPIKIHKEVFHFNFQL